MAAHDEVRRLVGLARDVVDRVPELPLSGSPRRAEVAALERTPSGGAERAAMLDKLNVEMQVMVGHLTLVVGGVADALEVAAGRDNEVNGPALAFVVRPALELAGQVAWLLTDHLDAEARARRYIIWQLADLRAQRLLLRDFRAPGEQSDAATRELNDTERRVLASADAAGWRAQPTRHVGPNLEAAVLLGSDGRPERLPAIGDLVREVSSTPATYGLLSVTGHSQRFGVMQGVKVIASSADGPQTAQVGGFPIPTNLLIGLTVLAVNIPARLLAGWNAVDASELHRFSGAILAKAGLG